MLALTRAASIDVGGVEYLVGKADGRVYFYDLRVEVIQGGKTVTENQRVILRPGQTIVAAFPGLIRDGVVPVANHRD